jgi:hypothetical protein
MEELPGTVVSSDRGCQNPKREKPTTFYSRDRIQERYPS